MKANLFAGCTAVVVAMLVISTLGAGRQTEEVERTGDMPMMAAMHAHHAMMANAWKANSQGVFVLRAGQLLRYSSDLKLVKSVELPREGTASLTAKDREGDQEGQRGSARTPMGGMAEMHGQLRPALELTEETIFVSAGDQLLKYDFDLELQGKATLPRIQGSPRAMMRMCPMCGRRMERRGQEDRQER